MAETNKRIYSYDSMRALACLAIVLLHTVSTWKADTVLGAGYYSQDTLRMLWNQGLNALLVRWAVPVFFMLSGALMLNPDKHVTLVKIKQHVLKMLAVLLTFGRNESADGSAVFPFGDGAGGGGASPLPDAPSIDAGKALPLT